MYRDTATGPQSSESLAVALGWFSLALGFAELAAPGKVARLIGVTPTDTTITTLRAFGAREVGTGIAILAQPDRAAWLWSRVAGDALDLATLGGAMQAPSTDKSRAMFAAASIMAVTALDILCAQQLADRQDDRGWREGQALAGRSAGGRNQRVRVSESVTINQSMERVEECWSKTESLPESLRQCTRSSDGSDERSIIEFRHAPGARGTEVRIEMEYSPRGGALGVALAKVMGGDPTGQLRHDLKRFKQIVETGEVVLSEGPSMWRPGQPPERVEDVRRAAGLEVSR